MNMKLFIITTVVESEQIAVDIKTTLKDAIDCAVDCAAEQQCDTEPNEIRAALKSDRQFINRESNIGDIEITILPYNLTLPKPKQQGKTDPHRLTIRVPVEISFTTDPAEMDDDREGEKKPTRKSLLDYLDGAFRLDIDTEGPGQPEGAVFAGAGVDWGKAELIKG
jgi:hypothetical protein